MNVLNYLETISVLYLCNSGQPAYLLVFTPVGTNVETMSIQRSLNVINVESMLKRLLFSTF